MTRIRKGGYVFFKWQNDHAPRHVHVYRDGALVVKFNQEARVAMKGKINRTVFGLIEKLEREGKL